MHHYSPIPRFFVLLLCLGISPRLHAAPATAPGEDVAALVSEIQAMKDPQMDMSRVNDAAYRESFGQQVYQFRITRGDRIKALYERFPHEPSVWKLMVDRWTDLARFGMKDAVIGETTPMLAAASDAQRADLLYVRAEAWVWPQLFRKDATKAVDEFLQAAPKDVRGSDLLFFLAQGEPNPDKRAEMYLRAAAPDYALSPYCSLAAGKAIETKAVGKTLDLSFQDVITGKPISLQKDLKGKIVVLIFWATWCGPCRAQMPGEFDLYNQYKSKGVEFIGISLDQSEAEGGLKALKTYLNDNAIPWPQYYQGNGVDSEFSSKLGVKGIPEILIIDRDGKVACAADGRLKMALDEMLKTDPGAR
jgi:thiol-disulfide isomerase/thioredoxin